MRPSFASGRRPTFDMSFQHMSSPWENQIFFHNRSAHAISRFVGGTPRNKTVGVRGMLVGFLHDCLRVPRFQIDARIPTFKKASWRMLVRGKLWNWRQDYQCYWSLLILTIKPRFAWFLRRFLELCIVTSLEFFILRFLIRKDHNNHSSFVRLQRSAKNTRTISTSHQDHSISLRHNVKYRSIIWLGRRVQIYMLA